MLIALASDHAGFELKEHLKDFLRSVGEEFIDVGCYSTESVDYPEFGRKAALMVASKECDRAILVCGTGLGMSIVANRVPGVRAALCYHVLTARLSREHNDSNVLCLGGRIIGNILAEEIVKTWLNTSFEGGRHQKRIDMIDQAGY